MRLVFSLRAARQLDELLDYIKERNPQGARHVQARIQVMMNLLLQHPMLGQATDRPGSRRLIVSPYPYAIYYSVRGDEILIQRCVIPRSGPFKAFSDRIESSDRKENAQNQ